MPLGFERLNERTQRPNALINFIKPLPGPDQATAQDFLSRIAAQCYPVMKANYISVMALEEYAPNSEFLGRNFNAGEVIQLVLKDKSGRWLGFKFVQMVMMHELAHCKQMNHSKSFWQVRNGYAKEMEELWAKKYAGEGMWGRGQDLTSGAFMLGDMPAQGDVPEHLCGGTYRRRGRKRKRGAAGGTGEGQTKLTYAERQQKRIARKFGKHGDGNALGDDELVRGALESAAGKRHAGKPRVANSKRGRELRAQAALARFEAIKKEPVVKDEMEDSGSETESDWEGDEDVVTIKQEDGEPDLVRVCGDEGEDEGNAQHEMNELRLMAQTTSSAAPSIKREPNDGDNDKAAEPEGPIVPQRSSSAQRRQPGKDLKSGAVSSSKSVPEQRPPDVQDRGTDDARNEASLKSQQEIGVGLLPVNLTSKPCDICSLENEAGAPLCVACSHVLAPKLVKDHWRCVSETCQESQYINAGDVGRCGVCGAPKPKPKVGINAGEGTGMKPVGVMSSDVLRWD